MTYKNKTEIALIAYFYFHGFDVHSFEDIIRLFVREAKYANKKSI